MAFTSEGIDTGLLHRYFWDRRTKVNGQDRVLVNCTRMADELGVTRFTIYRHLKLLTDAGKLRRIRRTANSVVMYEVFDPSNWTANAPPPEPEPERKPRVLKWG